MCGELRDYCYARDIINLDFTMYYHEFQTADGRLNKYPRGNPHGDHQGKAYRINRMQLSMDQSTIWLIKYSKNASKLLQ